MAWVFVGVATGLVLVWLAGDLVYAFLTRRRQARWEAGVERDPDGVRRGCREYDVGAGDTALLLVHGFADSPAMWQRMAPALAARGFACRALRLPGFALPPAEYRKTDARQWREAVSSALRELRTRHARVVAVGHSLGGAVVLDCLAEGPSLADGVVLLAPLIAVCNARSPLLPARAWYALLDRTLLFTDRVRLLFSPAVRDPEGRALMNEDRFVPRVVLREMFGLMRRNRARAWAFRLPLLMVLARYDEIVDNAAAERYFRDWGGAAKRLAYLTDAAHIVPLDHGWDAVVDEIARFCGELCQCGVPPQ